MKKNIIVCPSCGDRFEIEFDLEQIYLKKIEMIEDGKY